MNRKLTNNQKIIINSISAVLFIFIAIGLFTGSTDKALDSTQTMSEEDIQTTAYRYKNNEEFIWLVCEGNKTEICNQIGLDIIDNMKTLGISGTLYINNVQDYIDEIYNPSNDEEATGLAVKEFVDLCDEYNLKSFPQVMSVKDGTMTTILTDIINMEAYISYDETVVSNYLSQTKNLTLGWLNMLK